MRVSLGGYAKDPVATPFPAVPPLDQSHAMRLAMARLAVEQLRGDQAVGAAVESLVHGLDSPSLRILAGLDSPHLDEALPYLQAAARELQLPPMSRPAAAMLIAYSLARDILAGTITPHDGARAIWNQAYYEVQDQRELDSFVADADDLDDALVMKVTDPALWDGIVREAEQGIREAAAALVARYGASVVESHDAAPDRGQGPQK